MDVYTLADRLEALGVESVTIKGDEAWAQCPFHDDSNPSWSVNPMHGSHCFVCDRGNYRSLTKLFSAIARENHLPYDDEMMHEDALSNFDLVVPEKPTRQELDTRVLRSYTHDHHHFADAWGVDIEVASRHQLCLDPMTGAECFPIYDRFGHFYGFVERRVGPKRSIYHYPKALNRARMLLGEDHVMCGERPTVDTVWVVEGIRDLCAVETKVPDARAVAIGSATASAHQVATLRRFERVVLALDTDLAGRAGTEELQRVLSPLQVRVAVYDGKDPGEATSLAYKHPVFG